MEKKVIVITGSTRGIGFGLAKCFLEKGHFVVIIGTKHHTIEEALKKFEVYSNQVLALTCDVANKHDIYNVVKSTDERFGSIDIWINNAGVNQPTKPLLELEDKEIKKVIDINVHGVINGSRAAAIYMLNQGYGAIYNMEGLGSDGRIVNGTDYYGMTKRMVRYFTRCMEKEFRNKGIIIGRLSPGMVLTDLLLKDVNQSQNKESAMKIYRILADDVETVTNFLSNKILKNKKNGAYIAWLTTRKIIFRFLTAPIIKRDPFKSRNALIKGEKNG